MVKKYWISERQIATIKERSGCTVVHAILIIIKDFQQLPDTEAPPCK